jgi:protein phosphatase
MQLSSYGITNQGKVRHANETRSSSTTPIKSMPSADGLGGLPGGAEASQRIVELLEQTMKRVDSNEERVDLTELIIGINEIVAKEGVDAHPFTGSGSGTLTIAQIVSDQLLIGQHRRLSRLPLTRRGSR